MDATNRAWVLLATLTMSALTACSSSPPPRRTRPKALDLMHNQVPPDASASADAASVTKCPRGTVEIAGGRLERATNDESGLPSADIKPFCLDKTEVTTAAYRECVVAEKCAVEKNTVDVAGLDARTAGLLSLQCNAQKIDRLQHPMNCVDHTQAVNYCTYRGARLPTEDEWEWAARGREEARPFPWGDAAPSAKVVNACGKECAKHFEEYGKARKATYDADDGFAGTAPVGTYPDGASRDGILDLAGNVFEWTATTPEPDLVGHRGGSWFSSAPEALRVRARYALSPSSRDSAVGFRCALSKK